MMIPRFCRGGRTAQKPCTNPWGPGTNPYTNLWPNPWPVSTPVLAASPGDLLEAQNDQRWLQLPTDWLRFEGSDAQAALPDRAEVEVEEENE